MSRKSPHVAVEPAVIQWLRRSSGITIDEVSKRLNVSTELVRQWERGEKQPTLNQILEMARIYKRPSAAFFLPEPAEEPPLHNDFRLLSGESHPFTKKTLLAIRKARYLQSVSSDLMENLDQKTDADISAATVEDDPEEKASAERCRMGVSPQQQFEWKLTSEAFSNWRKRIEDQNIRVFQFPMNLEELRGLTLLDTKPLAIVVNSSDSLEARIFTLLHEYAHVLLHVPALCTPLEPTNVGRGKVFESWCNSFAGAFLLPAENVKEDFSKQHGGFRSISKKYVVSLSAAIIRLAVLGLISQAECQLELSKLRQTELKAETSGGGRGETSTQRASRERGDAFVSLVLQNSQKGYITHSDALDYLSIKMKHLKELTNLTP